MEYQSALQFGFDLSPDGKYRFMSPFAGGDTIIPSAVSKGEENLRFYMDPSK